MLLNEKISHQLKELRIKKGYSLSEMAELALVSKQGYHLWEQGLRAWKLDVLADLSAILGFKMVIENGGLEIVEHSCQLIKDEVKVMEKQVNVLKQQTQLKGYEVITLYTGVDNVNFEDGELLEDVLIYRDKKEAMDFFNTESLVPVYALFDIEAGSVCCNTYGLDKTKAYSFYYWNYAPILEEGNVIYIDTEKDIKISKGHALIDIHHQNEDGSYPVLDILAKPTKQTLGMFITTNLEGFPIPQLDYVSQNFPDILN